MDFCRLLSHGGRVGRTSIKSVRRPPTRILQTSVLHIRCAGSTGIYSPRTPLRSGGRETRYTYLAKLLPHDGMGESKNGIGVQSEGLHKRPRICHKPYNAMKLEHQRITVLVDKSFEDLEFWVPTMRLREEGAEVIISGRESNDTFEGKHGLTATTEVAARDLSADDLDGVVVPGGWAPDKLRRDEGVLSLIREMDAQNKIVAQICHAGLVGISAGIVEGRRATGSTGIKDDLINAGAEWVDEAAFRDRNLVWGRVVKDIPAFCRTLVRSLRNESTPASPPAE